MGGKPVWSLCPRENHPPGYPVKKTSQKDSMRHPSFPALALCVCRGVFTSQKSPSVTIETREGWSEGRSPTVLFLLRNLTILLKYRKFLISRQATCSEGFPEAAVTEHIAGRAGPWCSPSALGRHAHARSRTPAWEPGILSSRPCSAAATGHGLGQRP